MPLMWIVWLPALAYPIGAALQQHLSPLRLTVLLAGTAVFAAVYVWTSWHTRVGPYASRLAGRRVPELVPLLVLVAIGAALTLGNAAWLEFTIYVSAMAGGLLPLRRAIPALVLIGALAVLLGDVTGTSAARVQSDLILLPPVGLTVLLVVSMTVLNRQLQAAREEIVRLAVGEERQRFARDLHDLLGHTLSLIALKSELASRLATVSPDRAAEEMRDVERAARDALRDVRETVSGYRQPSLDGELAGARAILDAAGIAFEREGSAGPLPPAVEATLSWALREGMTNVIRHSGATRCRVCLGGSDGAVTLTIADDGHGPGPSRHGSGLVGLTERVQRLGGTVEAVGDQGNGFRLTIRVPCNAARMGAT
jgi:two-component system, NarL family, sensor histidine kinase DesK